MSIFFFFLFKNSKINVGVELVCCLASFRRFKFLFRMLITKNYKNIYVKIKIPKSWIHSSHLKIMWCHPSMMVILHLGCMFNLLSLNFHRIADTYMHLQLAQQFLLWVTCLLPKGPLNCFF